MNLIPKEILMSHLKRSEGAEEVSLPIDFFRDLLYQAMPRTWVGLTDEDIDLLEELYAPPVHPDFVNDADHCLELIRHVEDRLKEKNNG
jgi:hypothetical protein